MKMPEQRKLKYTQAQQEAVNAIHALLEIEGRTGVVTRRARNQVMQRLDPADLAVIAPELSTLNI